MILTPYNRFRTWGCRGHRGCLRRLDRGDWSQHSRIECQPGTNILNILNHHCWWGCTSHYSWLSYYFINLIFHQLDISINLRPNWPYTSLSWYFINLILHQPDTACPWYFMKLKLHQPGTTTTWYFINLILHYRNTLLTWYFINLILH